MTRTKHSLIPAFMLAALFSIASAPAQAGWFDWLKKDTYTATQYPFALAGGLGAPDGNFYRVPEELRRSGAKVFITEQAAFHGPEVRGEQLAREVEEILAATGAGKVHLIGHSQGAQTVRYVGSVYPQYVASVTTLSYAHNGSKIADLALQVTDGPIQQPLTDIIDTFTSFAYQWLGGDHNEEHDMMAVLNSTSTEGTAQFTAQHPYGAPTEECGQGPELAENGVRYYSWSGGTPFTNVLDPTDYVWALMDPLHGGESNDGMVGSCASHWGQVIRDDYRMNHMDAINHVFWSGQPV